MLLGDTDVRLPAARERAGEGRRAFGSFCRTSDGFAGSASVHRRGGVDNEFMLAQQPIGLTEHQKVILVATVGHTLVGLSFGGMAAPKTGPNAARYLWPGLLILFAHLLDLVEWFAQFFLSNGEIRAYAKHSPLFAAVLVGFVLAGFALLTRIRKPLPYALIASAVLSHWVLDLRVARVAIIDAYGFPISDIFPKLSQSMLAEAWIFGLFFVIVVLLQAGRHEGSIRRAGPAFSGLILISVVAALSRVAAIWMPAYGLALVCAAYQLRNRLRWAFLWSLAPLIPLLALVSVELVGISHMLRARRFEENERYAAAIDVYRQVLAMPTRSSKATPYEQIGSCYMKLGLPEEAERAWRAAQEATNSSPWPSYRLAKMYSDPRWKQTEFFRPREAENMLRRIVEGPYTRFERRKARQLLDRRRQPAETGSNRAP